MQISLEDVENEVDPYQLFLDSLNAKDTRRRYRNSLGYFLKAIPPSVFELSENAKDQEIGTLARSFLELARKDPELAKKSREKKNP